MRLFPKEIDFFEIFDKTSLNITKAASRLVDLMEIFDDIEVRAKEIHEIEQDSDMLTHDIMKKLNKTFITPIDREDLYSLASRMDDVIDLIWAVADRIAVFKLKAPMREAITMSPRSRFRHSVPTTLGGCERSESIVAMCPPRATENASRSAAP